MRGRDEGSGQDAPDERTPHDADAANVANVANRALLRRAAAGWLRRGYGMRYQDPHLAQLLRPGRPTWQGMLLIALAAPALVLAALLVRQGLRRRYWHTVSITLTPDRRVVTHRQWTPYRPDEP